MDTVRRRAYCFSMRTHLLITGLVLLMPSSALAASSVPPSVIRQIEAAIDAAFSSAQTAVNQAPIGDQQKSTVSNVLKTKHDTVKNSINNIR